MHGLFGGTVRKRAQGARDVEMLFLRYNEAFFIFSCSNLNIKLSVLSY